MEKKQYNSFSEIDKDLKVLKLKKEIAIWSAKNDYLRLQNNLAPKSLVLGAINSFANSHHSFSWTKALRNILIGYLLKRFIKR